MHCLYLKFAQMGSDPLLSNFYPFGKMEVLKVGECRACADTLSSVAKDENARVLAEPTQRDEHLALVSHNSLSNAVAF